MGTFLHSGVVAFQSKVTLLNNVYTGELNGQWVYAVDTQEYFYIYTTGEMSGALSTLESNGGLGIKIDESTGFALQVLDHSDKPILKLLSNFDLNLYGRTVYKGNSNNFGNTHNDNLDYSINNVGVFSVDDTITDSHIDIVFDVNLTSDKQDILIELKGAIPTTVAGTPRLMVITALGRFTDTLIEVSDIYDQFDITGAVSIDWVITEDTDENQNIIKNPTLRITNTAGNVGNTVISNINLIKGFYQLSNTKSIPGIKNIFTHNNLPAI
jgi:hypothetical protein